MFEYDRSGLELNSLWIEHRDDQKMKIKYESLSQDSILTIHYLHTPESEWKDDKPYQEDWLRVGVRSKRRENPRTE